MTECILVLNAGSSSIKFAVYQAANLKRLAGGQITGVNGPFRSIFEYSISETEQKKHSAPLDESHSHQQAIRHILLWIAQSTESWRLIAAGHRVVHGGQQFDKPVIINSAVLSELQSLEPLAPQHQMHNLAAIQAIAASMPTIPQVACFDTAFHATQSDSQRLLPIPGKLRDKGLMRYGFHGLSYEYLVRAVPTYHENKLPQKLIIAHLGNGASVCAVNQGKSVATSMGFSTLDGLVMGTRCGSIDPGVLLHLLENESLSVEQLSTCLYEESGLLGLSGLSSDIRELESSSSHQAKTALKVYVASLLKHIAAMASVLQGLDAIVFSGGVGENSVFIRQSVLTQMEWLGCDIDHRANQQGEACITTSDSSVKAYVIPTNEELIIATQTQQLCLSQFTE